MNSHLIPSLFLALMLSEIALASTRESDSSGLESACSNGRVQACTRMLVSAIQTATNANANTQAAGNTNANIAGNAAIASADGGTGSLTGVANTAIVGYQEQTAAANTNLNNSAYLERAVNIARATFNSQCMNDNVTMAAACNQLRRTYQTAVGALNVEQTSVARNLAGASAMGSIANSASHNTHNMNSIGDDAGVEEQVAYGHRIFEGPIENGAYTGRFTVPIVPSNHPDFLTVRDVISVSPSGTRCITNCK